jgi:hypothetical protein
MRIELLKVHDHPIEITEESTIAISDLVGGKLCPFFSFSNGSEQLRDLTQI